MRSQHDEFIDREDGSSFTVGVVGGLGPAATHRFFGQIIDQTPASRDQDHLQVLIDNRPEIPDRTAFLTGDGPDPRPLLLKTGRNLVDSGADILTMPCNTAHAFVTEVETAAGAPLFDMIDLTRNAVEHRIGTGRVGLLATDGTIRTGLYHDRFADSPVNLVLPDDDVQENQVMGAIYGSEGIKAGHRDRPRQRLLAAIAALNEIDAVILGCTELPLVLDSEGAPIPVFDPMEIMAEAVVGRAKGVEESVE